MKICIIGGGNIGTALIAYIKNYNRSNMVCLLTRRPGDFSETIICNDWEKERKYIESPDIVTDNPVIAVENADIVIIALPHYAIEKTFADIGPHVKSDAFIGVFPGGGGCEFFFHRYFTYDQTLFGIQRVPFTAKLVEYGKEVNLKSWKEYSVISTGNGQRLDTVCDLMDQCGLPTKKAVNYLSIALTPTNPILHTSRTYELFRGHDRDYVYSSRPKYYVGWTDETSRIMLAMDDELRALLSEIRELDTSAIRPLSEHYEAPTIELMTKKINSIRTFQSVYSPMKMIYEGAYVADTESRMFTEDFPWGLLIIRSYCDLFGVKADTMDEVLSWYAEFMGFDWYNDGKLNGEDLKDTGIITKYGIRTKEDLLNVYK